MFTRCKNCCTRTGACIIISLCVNEGCTRYHVAPFYSPHDMYCSFSIVCFSFEIGGTELYIFEI